MRQFVRRSVLSVVLASSATSGAFAQGGTSADSAAVRRDSIAAAALAAAPVAPPAPGAPVTAASANREAHFWLPVYEIIGFLAINNVAARIMYPNEREDGIKVYSSTFKSTWNHITVQRWVYDIDPFNTNQFQHPFQGASMYGFARSSGHGFWPSMIYSNVGSFMWKMAGETDPPSINDIITTGQAGSILGEAMYRMADLVMRDSGATGPSIFRQVASGVLSGGVNRRILGNHFAPHLPDSLPYFFWQMRFGASMDALARDVSTPTSLFLRRDATADFGIAYGLPGRYGYTYTRPFDYFDFESSVLLSSVSNFIETINVRGLLAGEKTKDTDNSRGIWGLYGSFDYISPFLFRVSSTALSLGTTREYKLGGGVALQGSLLAGAGFGAAGSTTIIASTPANAAIRDYHFGITPQALLNLRLLAGERGFLDMNFRDYYVSGVGSDDSRGVERIFRGDIGATIRFYKGNALGLKYAYSTRSASYGTLPPQASQEGSFTIVYTILGSRTFGTGEWK